MEKLCVTPDAVTEDEKVEAIYNARFIATLTTKLRAVLKIEED